MKNGYTETTISEIKAYSQDPAPRRNVLINWVWEMSAVSLSIATLLTAVGVLAREDKRPLSSWPFSVSLNTFIAILGTVSRITLAFAMSACIGQQKWNWLRKRPDQLSAFSRFDEGSRGPWGSTRLLFWLKMRHWGALGALATLGSIAFDPFLQAVISSSGQLGIASDQTTLLGRAESVNFGPRTMAAIGTIANSTLGGPLAYDVSPTPNFGVASAILNGFYNSSSFRNQTVGFRCSTGNCTWPLFTSAAVCSSCVDVSQDIQRSKHIEGENIWIKYSLPYVSLENLPVLPDGLLHFVSNGPVLGVNTTVDPNMTMNFQGEDTLLMSFLTIAGAPSWRANQTNWNESTLEAVECALSLCANLYRTEVTNGIFEETVIESWSIRNPASFQPSSMNSMFSKSKLDELVAARGNSLYKVNNTIMLFSTDLQLTIPSDGVLNLPSKPTTHFNISQDEIIGIIDYLRELTHEEQELTWPPIMDNTRNGSIPLPGPSIAEMLNNSTNITTTFARIAQSMTNQLRDMSATPLRGYSYQWTPHVKVQWRFLILPITVIVMGCIYVILAILESLRLNMPAWKEDALPTLLYGFDNETQGLLRPVELDSESSKVVEAILVKFDENDNRLRVVAKAAA